MKRRHRGMLFIEILVMMPILVIVLLVADQMFYAMTKVWMKETESADRNARIDTAITQFRQDVWASQSISTTDSHNVTLTFSRGGGASWKIEPDGTLTRTVPAGSTNWPDTAPAWTFRADGKSLSITDANATRPEELCLQSQAILMGGQP